MPELPDAHRVPQPSPRSLATLRLGQPKARKVDTGRIPDPSILPNRGPTPATVFVGGRSRSVVNGVAFALAETIDLTPLWLDVREPRAVSDGPDPGSTGWIPPERLFISEGGRGLEAVPDHPTKTIWDIVRSDEPTSVLSNLTDFLRLPELIQDILSTLGDAQGAKALVAANTDRIAHLFPRTADGLQRFLGTLAASHLSIVAAHTGATGPGRFGFATVFRVGAQSPAKWMEGTLVCEQGIDQGTFAVGRANRLSDIPAIARVLTNLFSAKPGLA
jgi:hypothetical protein